MQANPRQSWILDFIPRIPDSRYPVDRFQSLNLDCEFQSLVGLRIPDFKTRDSGFNMQNLPGFRISKAVQNPDCLNYMGCCGGGGGGGGGVSYKPGKPVLRDWWS